MSLFDSIAGLGVSAATGNVIGAGVQGIGLATSIFGGISQSQHASEAYGIQANISGLENKVNDQREIAMHLSARRQQMEVLRSNQRARAQGLNAAVSQGANFGTGYLGGQAQIKDQGAFNLAGINQNLEIGQNIFGLNRQISDQKLALSNVQSSMSTDQGISSLGGSIMRSGDPLSRLLQGFGGGSGISRETMGLNGLNAIS